MKGVCHKLLLLCVVASLGVSLASGNGLVSSPGGSIAIGTPGDTATVSVILSEADVGVAGFNATFAVDNSDVVIVRTISFSDWARLPANGNPRQGLGYATAVDLYRLVEPGAGSVTLFTLELQGGSPGAAILTITPRRIEDDAGGRYALNPLNIPIVVRESQPPMITASPASTSGGETNSVTQETQAEEETVLHMSVQVTSASSGSNITENMSSGKSIGRQVESPISNVPASQTTQVQSTPLSSSPVLGGMAGAACIHLWFLKRRTVMHEARES